VLQRRVVAAVMLGLFFNLSSKARAQQGHPCSTTADCTGGGLCYAAHAGPPPSGWCSLLPAYAWCNANSQCYSGTCNIPDPHNPKLNSCAPVKTPGGGCVEGADCTFPSQDACFKGKCCVPPGEGGGTPNFCSRSTDCCANRFGVGCYTFAESKLPDGGWFHVSACCLAPGSYCTSYAECCTPNWGSFEAKGWGQVQCNNNLCSACKPDGQQDGMVAECCTKNDNANVKDGGTLCCSPIGGLCDHAQSLLCCNGTDTPSTKQEGVVCGTPPGAADPFAGNCCFPNDAGPCTKDSDCCCGRCNSTNQLCNCY
jgi:hypothetical protein